MSPKTSTPQSPALDRRTLLKRAGVAGAAAVWAVPTITSTGTAWAVGSPAPGGGDPGPVATGTVKGKVVDGATLRPIRGAAVTAGSASTTTAADGAYTLAGVVSGSATVTVQAAGYTTATAQVDVPADTTTTRDFALSSAGSFRAILSWGNVSDLDLYVSGPKPDGTRFTAAYNNTRPVPYVSLDVDSRNPGGTETTTITVDTLGGAFVPGEYRVWVNNYSGSPAYDVNGARLALFGPVAQLGTWEAASASGLATDRIWNVVAFTVAADGSVTSLDVRQQRRADAAGL
ncbi:carboxypeptidase-like regulatory domain-containing protein [Motilibacter aurantiacus]|uniref:carboxypeptidase-like regulatory domain-containing protein n=1 Tax=Motilibacter aurantiacus TaxID=2714955 RepID=UPI00140B27BC|nr:carboxypeptidase-like regulatory domain-containing protein [Motilibacter aurantiacus]NHC45465.1 carboxypeptidase regulatory-like domain-containing protein [Motilibacter aurantiacus]